MSDVVTLAEAKGHLRVTQNSEDTTIAIYIAAASQYIRNFLNTQIPGEDQVTPNIPADIKAAGLLLIGGMYEVRSDVIVGNTVDQNPSARNLLMPYRKEMGI